MIRVLVAFLVLFVLFFVGIKAFREITGLEKWQLTKYLAYAILCAMLSIAVLISIVIVF